MRWFTCTPRDYPGNPDFFSRDTGLLCRGFQQLGIDSMAVMTGLPQDEDDSSLLRTPIENLESPEWWASHHLDGVVLYAWGRPRYLRVARAIRRAGIFLILNQDSNGWVSPMAGFANWLRDQRNIAGNRSRFFRSVIRQLTLGLLVTDPLRAQHLSLGHVIACVSPAAARNYRRVCRVYGGKSLARRVALIPHPVMPIYRYRGLKKTRTVVCVGRWDDQDAVQKRPELLIEVMSLLLAVDPEVSVTIAGTVTDALKAWHSSLPSPRQTRVSLPGRLAAGDLSNLYETAMIFYSPSAYESFGIAAAEALCSGCSVVGEQSISMASFQWFVSENSGTLADSSSPSAHLSAIRKEFEQWTSRHRNASGISTTWCQRLHADKVASRMLQARIHWVRPDGCADEIRHQEPN